MSVKKRGDIWHYDFAIDGVRYRGSTQQRGKAAAIRAENQERERAKLGRAPAEIPTLKAAADRWFAARMADKKSAGDTAYRIEIALRLIGPHRRVTDITTADIEEAIQTRRLEITPRKRAPTNATVNRDLIDSTLRPILRYCRRKLELPVKDVDWPELRLDEPKERVRAFAPAELEAWADALPAWHVPVRDFIKRYGVRLAEAFFPLSAINTETWEITVRGPKRKNGRPHVIPLLEEDARDIAARMGRAKAAKLDTVWFRERKNGRLVAITPRGFAAASKVALQAVGIDDARPVHDLRHHAGTEIMRSSGNLKVVQALLGHESITSTARYAHADQSDVLKALRHATGTAAPEPEKNVNEDKVIGDFRS